MLALVVACAAALPRLAAAEEQEEIAHPFFTRESLPDALGSYSVRGAGLVTRIDGTTKGDFACHVETGLTDNIGLHIRADQFLLSRRSEIMFQFVALKNKDGENGFAPIIDIEVPTRTGAAVPRSWSASHRSLPTRKLHSTKLFTKFRRKRPSTPARRSF